MSFEETKAGFFWTCDSCGLVAEFAPVSFWRAVDELKARAWQFDRDEEGTWMHLCGKCRKSGAEILEMPAVAKARR